MKCKFDGLIVPCISIFDSSGHLDKKLNTEHMDWLLKNGADGLFVAGTYGSGSRMNNEERLEIYKIAAEAAKHKDGAFVIAHVGSTSKDKATELTFAAAETGVDAVCALEPLDEKLSEDELLDFYGAIIKAAGKMPFFAYNNPAVSGRALDRLILGKLKKLGAFGFKDSTVDMQLAAFDCGMKYIAGSSKNWNEMHRAGITAVISGMANYAPDAVSLLMKICEERPEKADEAQQLVNKLNSLTKVSGSIESTYIALAARGRDAGFMKLPTTVGYAEHTEDMQRINAEIESCMDALKGIYGKEHKTYAK